MRGILVSILLGWSLSLLWAQPGAVHFFSVQEGLSNQQVLDIVQDDDGFVWMATELGLNRFSGSVFKSYYKSEKQDGSSVNSNEINTLLYDDNKLYIGTRSNGLNILDRRTNRFSYFLHDPSDSTSIATNDITDMIKRRDGSLYLATYHQGIQRFDSTKKQFKHWNRRNFPALPENSIWALAEDENRMLYVGHVNQGLSIIDPDFQQVRRLTTETTNGELPDNEVKALFCDRHNNIWIGTRRGLAVYNHARGKIRRIPLREFSKHQNEPFVYTIKEINGALWVGSESSQVFILQPIYGPDTWVDGVTQSVVMDLRRGNNASVQHIASDRFGNVWLALYGGGVGFVSHLKPFFNVFPSAKEPGEASYQIATVSAIVPDSDYSMWLATEGSG